MPNRFVQALAAGAPLEPYLEQAGEPDPAGAARAFQHAALHLDLARQLERWALPLLCSARPGFGAASLAELARSYREWAHQPLELERFPLLPLLLGSSNFLARLLVRDPSAVEELTGVLPDAPAMEPEPDWDAIRTAKYRGLLRIAARDLAGRDFAESLGELSRLADACLRAAAACAEAETGVPAPAVFALGKLGGRELNLSSDVDLLVVYEAPPGHDDLTHNQRVARWVQQLKRGLEKPSELGFAYRVDLDLRPEGRSGVLANSVDAALAYYESFGAEWERQALIRLRHVVGPRATAERFEQGIQPFVYRRSIDPGVLHSVHAMKKRIEAQRRADGRDVSSDLKEGPGGIRDVEFLVQALQLLYGGREPRLRTGNVLEGLAALRAAGIMPEETEQSLRQAYLWLRRAEHALQLAEERQTQRVPREPAARLELARRMGYAEPEGARALERWLDDWSRTTQRVRSEFDALVLEREP